MKRTLFFLLSMMSTVLAIAETTNEDLLKEIQLLQEQAATNHFYFDARLDLMERNILQAIDCDGGGTVPPIEPDPDFPILNTTFLKDDANWTTHTILSYAYPADSKHADLDWLKEQGYNIIHVYPWVDGDYGGRLKFNYKHSDKEYVAIWVEQMRLRGLDPCFWLMADDGFSYFDRNNVELVKQHWKLFIEDIIKPLGIRYIVLGLEALEYWSESQAIELGTWLENELPNVTIFHHTLPNDKRLCNQTWVDVIALQTGFGLSGDQIAAMVQDFLQFNKPVIAAEHNKSGETKKAMDDGTQSITAGSNGSWTGARKKE